MWSAPRDHLDADAIPIPALPDPSVCGRHSLTARAITSSASSPAPEGGHCVVGLPCKKRVCASAVKGRVARSGPAAALWPWLVAWRLGHWLSWRAAGGHQAPREAAEEFETATHRPRPALTPAYRAASPG